jgi:hypothetical protein
MDKQSRSDMGQGLTDSVNRGAIAGLLGGPVDAVSGVVNAGLMGVGYAGNKIGLLGADRMPQPIQKPVGGSEWIGDLMQRGGMVSENRNTPAEMLVGLLAPSAVKGASRAAFAAENNAMAPTPFNSASKRQLGAFIGPNAKTWNQRNAANAVAMEKEGASRTKIWEETGTFRGPDGVLRQEVSDKNAAWRADFDAAIPRNSNSYIGAQEMPIGGAISHPDLFAAYPDMLPNMRIDYAKRPDWMGKSGDRGEYRTIYEYKKPDSERVSVRNTNSDGALSTVLHEFQHAIQKRENTARGGNESMFSASENPFESYRRLAGEVEARAVQARQKFTPEELRRIHPLNSYDTPLDQLIFK